MGRNIPSRFKRRPRGSVHLVGVNRQVFSWIYQSRFATRAQLTLAVRGRRVDNDRYIARALRKLFDHAYIAKVPGTPFEPDIYCVSGRCGKGRAAARAIYGDDSRIVAVPSKVRRTDLQHALALTWLRVLAHRSSLACQWKVEFLDHQSLSRLALPLVPDGAALLKKGKVGEGTRGFLIEYQRSDSARKTTHSKLHQYRELLPEYEDQLSIERSWVVFVMERPDGWVRDLSRQLEHEGVLGTFFLGSAERVFDLRADGFWTEPVFYLPGEEGPCSIFKVPQEEAVLYEAG